MVPTRLPFVLMMYFGVQMLDGVLTLVGTARYGIGVEANVLIHTVMSAWGAAYGLLWAKLLASVCGVILYRTGRHRLLVGAVGAYVAIAIVPWCLVLWDS